MGRKLVSIFILVFCLSFMLIGVGGHNPGYEVVAVYGLTPTIDGSISVGEWNDASSVSFNNTEVFVKQDGKNLYIAFNVSDAPFHEEDAVGFYFDVNHDGGSSSQQSELVMAIQRSGTLVEGNLTGGIVVRTDVTGWTATFHSDSNMWQAEFNITYSKIEVTASVEKTIGAAFLSNCKGCQPYPFTWPPEDPWNLQNDPSTWGDISSTGYNWIPEFPSFLALLLFMIVLLLLVTIRKRFTDKP